MNEHHYHHYSLWIVVDSPKLSSTLLLIFHSIYFFQNCKALCKALTSVGQNKNLERQKYGFWGHISCLDTTTFWSLLHNSSNVSTLYWTSMIYEAVLIIQTCVPYIGRVWFMRLYWEFKRVYPIWDEPDLWGCTDNSNVCTYIGRAWFMRLYWWQFVHLGLSPSVLWFHSYVECVCYVINLCKQSWVAIRRACPADCKQWNSPAD